MKLKLSPYIIILLSFLSVILIGSILLMLPISLNKEYSISYIDSLFISASNVTIAGLTPLSINDTFSTFGKVLIVILTQIGGLSVTTIAFFIISLLGAKIGFGSRKLVVENTNMNSMKGVIRVVKNIVILALVIEVIGSIIFTIYFLLNGYNLLDSLGYSIFHTVASYNNSGFDIFGNSSLIIFKDDIFFNIVTMILIVSGGLGSVVIFDILHKKSYKKLTFHSKIVLRMTLILLVFGSTMFFILEKDASILQSLFHSVSLRTAGFYTYDYNIVRQTTLLIMVLLMFIGGAPGSNAGGIKVTTVYTLYKTSVSYIKDDKVIAYKRSIPKSYQKKAFMVIFISLNILVLATLAISIFESEVNLTTIFFEVVSAFSSTGITLNLTKVLSTYSKIIIIIIMFIGRLGVLVFIKSLVKSNKAKSSITEYVDLEYVV